MTKGVSVPATYIFYNMKGRDMYVYILNIVSQDSMLILLLIGDYLFLNSKALDGDVPLKWKKELCQFHLQWSMQEVTVTLVLCKK